jgi:hypothetical protein
VDDCKPLPATSPASPDPAPSAAAADTGTMGSPALAAQVEFEAKFESGSPHFGYKR